MYTVLIADDEPLVQVGLQSMVDWKSLDVVLLPSVSNGQAALESIIADSPDLVFTDIRMPLIDGLELIRRCRAEVKPCPEFVVLTSFEDFGYAREAVKHQVVDYLVKLELTPEILVETFEKARRLIDAGKAVTASRSIPDRGFRDRVLFSLLNRDYAAEELARGDLAEVGVEFGGIHLAAVTCRLPQGDAGTYPYALKMVEEILGREYQVQTLPYSKDRFVILLAAQGVPSGPESVETRLASSLMAALAMAQRYFNDPVEAGVGRAVPQLLQLADSYRESLKALEACTPANPVVTHRSLGGNPGPELSGEAFRKDLETALETQDPDALGRCFGLARVGIENHGRLSDALDLGTAAVYAVLSVIPGAEAWLSTVFSTQAEGYKSLYSVPSTTHVLGWLSTLEAGLAARFTQGAQHQERLVDSMRKFVEVHYRERLQLKTVAEHFRLSPNYAGTLFRKFTGKGFSEFISELKVAKAQELLTSRKYRVYEVSELLGFENSYYFSKVFRRVTGTSPRAYLARLENPPSD